MAKAKVKKTLSNCDFTMLIARLSVIALFANSLFGKVTEFSKSAQFAETSWMGKIFPGELIIVAGILMLLVGIITIVLGWNMEKGAYVLAIYTLLATLMFHIGEGQTMAFLKNLAIFGGLLALARTHPGKFSL
jgi:putative oxidoreductase